MSGPESVTDTVVRHTLRGVDVSGFQGKPAAWRDPAGNIGWAAVKLTELEPNGIRYVNPDAAADWAWLKQHRKYRIAYLFGHPSVSAADTVDFFLSELDALGLDAKDGVALDLEVTDGLTASEVSAWAQAVMADLSRRLTRRPILYTFLSFAGAGNCVGLGGYPLWIADPSSKPGHPQVPAPWKIWALHQYATSSAIDRDLARYPSQAAMAQAFGKPKEPDVQDLGGSIVAAVSSARWPDGVIVVAGLGKDGHIQARRFAAGKWEPWKKVGTEKARGAPSVLAIGAADGHLYHSSESGAVLALETADSGATWT
jgi:lysozyme